MKGLNAKKVGLAFGFFFSGWHLGWIVLILIGFAQPLLDFIFWAHMISNPYQITGFNITQALTLVIITFIFGYLVGWIFSWIWNKLQK